MNGSTSHPDDASHDTSFRDIPHSVDLQAVLDILRRFYPHLDIDDLNRRLIAIVQGQGRIAIMSPDTSAAG